MVPTGIGIIFVAAAPIFLMVGAGAAFCSYYSFLSHFKKFRDDQQDP